MQIKHQKLLKEYLLCIKEERYFDAHEKLEELWFPRRYEKNNEINLLKGFINAAVSFELLKRNRPIASKKAWNTYLKYRPLLYKVDSAFLRDYHHISRYIENIKYTKQIY
jgi:hypothetical protein